MTEPEFLDQLDAWALGGLDATEHAAMAAYAAAHPSVAAAVRRAFTTAAALGAALPAAAPEPALWDRVATALPGRGEVVPLAPRRRRAAAVGWVVAAIAAGVAVWLLVDRRTQLDRQAALARQLRDRDVALVADRDRVAAAVTAQTRLDGCVRDLEVLRSRDALAGEAVALLELAGTQLIPLDPRPGPGPARPELAANAIYHRGVKKAYVMAKGLPTDGAVYRIWVNRGGQHLAAGDLVASPDGAIIASVSADSLDDVPESFEITAADGAVVLASKIRI